MAVFKCKMCGGTLEINDKESVAVCEYCGTKQTIPKIEDERKENLYGRANHFRRSNEYDKAMNLYEQILAEDNTDAEAYWSIVLCRYGIEYVEDSVNGKRVPTVNRAQYTSIFADEDYKAAIINADYQQREIYEKEAKAIDDIQKGILAVSSSEEPFDVFICYKETDESGRRTRDSVLAADLYHQLEQEGFKTFFSRITLEDKLGFEYEPYIFAALNSAKVMVVIGTKPEHFNAVWVKNEWSRYLALIRKGEKKILIPAYRDMDPYDLPDEFGHLQAQDMSKLGFMQDLIRGIKKITETGSSYAAEKSDPAASPFIKRAFIFLEDGDWRNADEYSEKALDIDPENAEAYLVKLMAEYKIHKKEDLAFANEDFNESSNCKKILRYGSASLKNEIFGYINASKNNRQKIISEARYKEAYDRMDSAKTMQDYLDSAKLFDEIFGYKDSGNLANICRVKADNAKNKAIYDSAKMLMESGEYEKVCAAEKRFGLIPGWEDSLLLEEDCANKKIELRYQKEAEEEKAEKSRKKKHKIASVIGAVVLVFALFGITFIHFIAPSNQYNDALMLLDEKQFDEAEAAFAELGDYKDSFLQAEIAMIEKAKSLAEEGKYSEAEEILDEKVKKSSLHGIIYTAAEDFMSSEKYEQASFFFNKIERYEDSFEKRKESDYLFAKECFNSKDYEKAVELYKKALPYNDSQELLKESIYFCGLDLIEKEDYEKAIEVLEYVPADYKDVFSTLDNTYLKYAEVCFEKEQYINAAKAFDKYSNKDPKSDFYKEVYYNGALLYMEMDNDGTYVSAANYLNLISGYKDSKELLKECKYAYVQLNMVSNDLITYEYLKELKKAKYKDSADLFRELYAWRAENVYFNSEKGSSVAKTSLSYSEPMYLHFTIVGGEPGGSTKVKVLYTEPNGYTGTDWFSGSFVDGEKVWASWTWNQNANLVNGTYKVILYDEAGYKIGEGSVKLTK